MVKLIRILLIMSGALLVFFETSWLVMLTICLEEYDPTSESSKEMSMFLKPGVNIGLLITGMLIFGIGARIDDWLSQVGQRDLGATICWFCEKRPPDSKSICEVKMHCKIDEQTNVLFPVALFRSIRYQKRSIEIPRCEICKTMHEHEKIGMVLYVVGFFGMIAGMAGVCVCYLKLKAWVEVVIAIVVLFAFLILSGAIIGTLPVKSIAYHPKIKSLSAQGWEIGEKPKV